MSGIFYKMFKDLKFENKPVHIKDRLKKVKTIIFGSKAVP